jgi:hypothetical protein
MRVNVSPSPGTKSQFKFFDSIAAQSPFGEITQADTFAFIIVMQIIAEIILRKSVDDIKALPAIFLLNFLVCALLFLNLDMIFIRQVNQRLAVAQLFMLHHKPHRIPTFSAPKTLINPLGHRNRKRRRLFIMERAFPNQVHPPALQIHKIPHHLLNPGSIHNPPNRFLRYHPPKLTDLPHCTTPPHKMNFRNLRCGKFWSRNIALRPINPHRSFIASPRRLHCVTAPAGFTLQPGLD